jgi:hypothetical protein
MANDRQRRWYLPGPLASDHAAVSHRIVTDPEFEHHWSG